MSSQNSNDDDADIGKAEASLFEAISHDTRIRILFILRNHPIGFSELRHELAIKSSGNLQHHIGKLEALVNLNGEGLTLNILRGNK